MTKVTVYSKNGCGQCMFLKNMLKGEQIDFEERNISEDESAMSYLQDKGITSLPYVESPQGISFTGVRPDLVKQLNA